MAAMANSASVLFSAMFIFGARNCYASMRHSIYAECAMLSPIRLSVCRTGGSVKSGWS